VITLAAAQPFIILGDAIWIDFVNTARGTGPVADRLVDHAAYLQWTRLEKLPPDDPPVPFTDILEFRDRLTGLARAVSAGKQAPASAIHAINAILAQGSGYHQLTRVQGSWRTVFTPVRAATALDAVARSAALTLSDPEAVIRQCSGPQCTLYFIDSSPNHSRRWCSGATCGKQLRVERRRTAR
jgi:predicted RNA-binding Zn ribbon-like protein